jgi:hypothetical protein
MVRVYYRQEDRSITASEQTTVSICRFMYLLAIACALCAHNASAQTIQKCAEQIRERTASMVARDWPSLDRLAKRYVHREQYSKVISTKEA